MFRVKHKRWWNVGRIVTVFEEILQWRADLGVCCGARGSLQRIILEPRRNSTYNATNQRWATDPLFIALMNWPKLGISDTYNKEQTEQQTLRSNLPYNHFNSALHVNSLEVLPWFAPSPKRMPTESESGVTVPVWTFPPFDESWRTGTTPACERRVENTPFEKSKLCFLHLITW